jgi:peptidoglycan/LPS O-acetylase OafA/YrhL
MPAPARSGYLDQWRGISVLMVVVHHFLFFRFSDLVDPTSRELGARLVRSWHTFGGLVGVCIFFCISGYLITSLMLKEEARTGTVSLPRFWVRRAFRILPAMVVYVLSMAALDALGAIRMAPGDAAKAMLFLCNTPAVECGYHFGHFWSLAVEEQFYLLWPLLFLVTGRHRTAVVAVAFLVSLCAAAMPGLRVAGWINNGLAFACISAGALYASSPRFRALFSLRLSSWVMFPLLVVGMPMAWGRGFPALVPLVLPFVIVATVIAREGKVSNALRCIGLASYSLYLWQGVLTWDAGRYLTEWIAVGSVLVIPIVWLSYRYVELPCVAWGHRLAARLDRAPAAPLPREAQT